MRLGASATCGVGVFPVQWPGTEKCLVSSTGTIATRATNCLNCFDEIANSVGGLEHDIL